MDGQSELLEFLAGLRTARGQVPRRSSSGVGHVSSPALHQLDHGRADLEGGYS
jgi:hypothetical protein